MNSDVPRSPKFSGEMTPNSLVAITPATKMISASSAAIDAMPGIAASSPETTFRMDGTTEISRSTRSTRSDRSTANGPVAGITAMPTTSRSKTFQLSRKNPPR
ncbi:MAG: hypothetical protein QOI78_5388 [Actinomycetota bacterium]|nr:hypothetical protein [Actinomycetota bacterium]